MKVIKLVHAGNKAEISVWATEAWVSKTAEPEKESRLNIRASIITRHNLGMKTSSVYHLSWYPEISRIYFSQDDKPNGSSHGLIGNVDPMDMRTITIGVHPIRAMIGDNGVCEHTSEMVVNKAVLAGNPGYKGILDLFDLWRVGSTGIDPVTFIVGAAG